MALTRARFLLGKPSTRRFLDELKEEVLFRRPAGREEIASLLEMRKKIEREKGEETLKAAPGGLIDVEFIAQAMVLVYGSERPALHLTSTIGILRTAAVEGILDEDEARRLIESYNLLREIENRLRIVNNLSIDRLPDDPDQLEALTRRYALKLDTEKITPASFLEMIHTHTQGVRDVFLRFFQRVCPACPPIS